MEQHHEHHNGIHEHHVMTESEINITVSYKHNLLSFHLEDNEGNAPEFVYSSM